MNRITVLFFVVSCFALGQQKPANTFSLTSGSKIPFHSLSGADDIAQPQVRTQSALPEAPPDRFDIGYLSSFNQSHADAIKDLQQRVRDIEANINWGRGVVAGAIVLLVGIAAFLKAFWRSLLKVPMHEAGPKIAEP